MRSSSDERLEKDERVEKKIEKEPEKEEKSDKPNILYSMFSKSKYDINDEEIKEEEKPEVVAKQMTEEELSRM